MTFLRTSRGRRWRTFLTALFLMLTPVAFSSCGSMHSYWGVENDYYSDFDGDHHHHGKKRYKDHHKKYKKYKKHHKHHHHDDDDDD